MTVERKSLPTRLGVVDSHTSGEQNRIVFDDALEQLLDLGSGSVATRRDRFRERYDHVRRAIAGDPRGADAMVSVITLPPSDASCVLGVFFFNRVGYLEMCSHATIGLAVTLGHLGRITPGAFRLETPAGVVGVTWHGGNDVTFESVRPRRIRRGLAIPTGDGTSVTGDVATSGLRFFLTRDHGIPVEPSHITKLTERARAIRRSLEESGITGDCGKMIDHVVLLGPPRDAANHGSAFVLSPDGAFERSPCGTATSALLGCLHEDGVLAEQEAWRQESILGGVYEASYSLHGGVCVPSVRGKAWITAETVLHFDPDDPYLAGLPR